MGEILKMVCETGMLRNVTVVKVEHEDKFLTRVFVESSQHLGDKFMWSMPYNSDWVEGLVLDMIVNVMDSKTRLEKQRERI